MAELAGSVGDGINTQASHPLLPDLIQRARAAHAAAGHAPDAFLVTVFAGLEDRWLDPRRPGRARLEELGVSRLVLLVSAPFTPTRIRSAGQLLRSQM
jgi:alkanesulfonate monooxygenase SsuD/methylene tetrahydromethanopterin reductase-like flavin-dependent oxidoreductase (luciferase family)